MCLELDILDKYIRDDVLRSLTKWYDESLILKNLQRYIYN